MKRVFSKFAVQSKMRRILWVSFVLFAISLLVCSYGVVIPLTRQRQAQRVLDQYKCFNISYDQMGDTHKGTPRWITMVLPKSWVPSNHVIREAYIRSRSREEMLAILQSLPTGCRIEMLSLEFSNVKDEDVSALSEIVSTSDLRSLWLDGCPSITDEGILAARRFENLKWLLLDGTSISDKSMETLSQMKLKELHIIGTRVSPPAIEEFRRRNPGVAFVSE